MNSSKKSRFLLSTFTAALMVFAWTGASQADQLWVASGTDDFGKPVNVDIDVASVVIPFDSMHASFATQLTFTYKNLSPPGSQAVGDLKVGCFTPVSFDFISGTHYLNDWNRTITNNPFTVTLTSPSNTEDIKSGEQAVLTIIADVGTEPEILLVSSGHQEITATLVPEPSSMVLATFGALGLLGYSHRRRIAK
jgi:PEP-CTERM motif